MREYKLLNYDYNSNGRYELKIIDNVVYIRATHGHSINIRNLIDNTFQIVTNENLDIIHSTKKTALNTILEEGIKPMKRLYIHLKSQEITKRNRDVFIYLDLQKCNNHGIKIYKNINGIMLADTLMIPKECFKQIKFK